MGVLVRYEAGLGSAMRVCVREQRYCCCCAGVVMGDGGSWSWAAAAKQGTSDAAHTTPRAGQPLLPRELNNPRTLSAKEPPRYAFRSPLHLHLQALLAPHWPSQGTHVERSVARQHRSTPARRTASCSPRQIGGQIQRHGPHDVACAPGTYTRTCPSASRCPAQHRHPRGRRGLAPPRARGASRRRRPAPPAASPGRRTRALSPRILQHRQEEKKEKKRGRADAIVMSTTQLPPGPTGDRGRRRAKRRRSPWRACAWGARWRSAGLGLRAREDDDARARSLLMG